MSKEKILSMNLHRQTLFISLFQYNQIYDLENSPSIGKLVLDYDIETGTEIVSVDAGLVKKLKPHQARGIKFMWDACYESVNRLNEDRGGGCILAHCMGLGKYFSVFCESNNFLLKNFLRVFRKNFSNRCFDTHIINAQKSYKREESHDRMPSISNFKLG